MSTLPERIGLNPKNEVSILFDVTDIPVIKLIFLNPGQNSKENELQQDDLQINEIREHVIFFLLLITSEDALNACQEFFPQEKLAYELCRTWFDEIYAPGLSYLDDSLKGDFSEEKVRQFEEAFDVEEIIELERFHRFFELRVEMLHARQKSAAGFPEDDMWRNLVKHAAYLLEALTPNAKKMQDAFGKKIIQAINSQKNILAASDWREFMQG